MQHSSDRPIIVLSTLLLSVIFVIGTAIQPWIDVRWLYLDMQTVAQISEQCCRAYDGAVSTLGIMLWVSTGAAALFAAFIFSRMDRTEHAMFALHAGLLSVWLALDDAFLLHEVVLPRLGIPQIIVIAGLGAATIFLLLAHTTLIRKAHVWLLGIALAMFATSLVVDQLITDASGGPLIVLEDGSKLIGIVAWFLFFVTAFLDMFDSSDDAHPV